jgi:hypothetical protein
VTAAVTFPQLPAQTLEVVEEAAWRRAIRTAMPALTTPFMTAMVVWDDT